MEKIFKGCVCITALLCSTEEINNIVGQLYFNNKVLKGKEKTQKKKFLFPSTQPYIH